MVCNKKILSLLTVAFLLSGCALGSGYRPPEIKPPSEWQTERAVTTQDLTTWWERFKDPCLITLIRSAQKDNPTLDKAAAAIEKARAQKTSAEAGLFPSLNGTADATASGSFKNGSGTTTSNSSGLDASWELDLFGKTRRSTESANALLEAREADWHDARISLVAEVAGYYAEYRAGRIKHKYYEEQAESQKKTCDLTRLSAKAGFTADADVRLVEASLAETRATALSQKAECGILIKSLVALTGIDEPALREILGPDTAILPQPEGFQITSVPANLLRQRPDIVAAERELASTYALIGVAEAAQWPSLTLGGSVGIAKTNGTSATAPWSFGPSLNLPLFDGGSIKADIKSARADYESALAGYKQTVRDAVKDVEQALVRLDSLTLREAEGEKSAKGYRAYLTAVEQNYRSGGASMLNLETARRSTISAEVSLLELQQNRLLYWIALYKAVGGGFQAGEQGKLK